MATASLGKTVVYKAGTTNTTQRIGSKIDLTQSQAAVITKIEQVATNVVSLTVFLDNGDTIHVPNVKNDDTMAAAHSWAYPV